MCVCVCIFSQFIFACVCMHLFPGIWIYIHHWKGVGRRNIKSNLWRATWWSSAAFTNNTISYVKWIFALKIIQFFSLPHSFTWCFRNCEGLLLSIVTNTIIVHMYAGKNKIYGEYREGFKRKRFSYTTSNSSNASRVQPPEKWNFIKSQLKFLETRTSHMLKPLCS